MTRLKTICAGLFVLAAAAAWAQADPNPPTAQADSEPAVVEHPEDRMKAPPPVTGMNYNTAYTSEERGNYLRYGMAFTSAHSDNALGGLSSDRVSDFSYSLGPMLVIDETTSRMHWVANYAPGFTVYQQTSSRNEADHNASIDFTYRFSPKLTFSAHDGFQRSSNVFNQTDLGAAGAVSGGTQVPNFSVIAPIASRLSNAANMNVTYQFALNDMVGAAGTFTNLHYPDPAQVPGLYDSSSQGGSVFYSHRVSDVHYFGVAYQYERLLSYPSRGPSETQIHAALMFYTVYPDPHVSISMFGGPELADNIEPSGTSAGVSTRSSLEWTPAAGASLAWQGRFSSLALSYSHVVAGGGGLIGSVHLDSGTISFRRQLTRSLSGSVTGGYTENKLIGYLTALAGDGHSIFGTASVQKQLGEHLNCEVGYTRLHQSYSVIPLFAKNPDTNREYISISYQFSRPLGR
jgi:hypothetical protein